MNKRVVGSRTAARGDDVTYRHHVSNRGPQSAPAPIQIRDALPRGFQLKSASGRGWDCTADRRTDVMACVRDRGLATGKRAPVVTVVAEVTKAAAGRRVVNTAYAHGPGDRNPRNPRNPRNNSGSAALVPPAPKTGYRMSWRRGAS